MPKRAKELSAIEVKRLEYPFTEMQSKGNKLVPVVKAVGGVPGLLLQLTPGGGKSWIFRYSVTVGGKQKRKSMGLGSYPTYGLAEARDKARAAVRMLDEGLDPIKQQQARRLELKRDASKPTFAMAVDQWVKDHPSEFSNDKYKAAWINSVKAVTALQNVYVDQVEDRQVWAALSDQMERSPDLGTRVAKRIATVLGWAAAERHIDTNPADTEWMKAKIKAARKGVKKQQQASFKWERMPAWWAALARRGNTSSAALQFLALSAVRSGDVNGMTWDEVDLEKRIWTIPAERLKIKNKSDHVVPLNSAMLAILKAQPTNGGLVFPAARGGPMSDATMRKEMKAVSDQDPEGFCDGDRVATPHGLRATFRTWAGEHGYPRELAELALAHVFGDETERAYQRSTYVDRRRPMMDHWADFITATGGGKVVEMRRG